MSSQNLPQSSIASQPGGIPALDLDLVVGAMKRKKFLWYFFCINNVLFYCGAGADGTPAQNLHNNIAVNKFQSVLQQQSFVTILTSIEERLRNLDNVYSMQLSQTLESKLDQYNRRLQALDTKIIRLEALVMLNLDKISENISTKNFKDDVTKTNTYRKIDAIYEGISHRLNYMDRKYETSFTKIQSKMDATLTRLENLEERMITRDSDIEGELSDSMFAIDELKTRYNAMESKLLNATSTTLNITRDNYNFFKQINVETRKAANRLHDNIIESLQYIDNRTSGHFKTIHENNMMLKTMKIELKQDFNDYANKVADMNSYIWKNGDTTEDDLKSIASVVNSTKTEVQNGVRALMIQIGKLSSKDNFATLGDNSLGDMSTQLNANFNKILKNQDIFLESCHRLQMDESQIETEISAMLEKLIDMLEKKMATEMKDIKNLEKLLKGHDNRINRNVFEVNSNIFSFYGKVTAYNDNLKREMQKIGNDLDALFAFVQSIVTASNPIHNMKVILEKLNRIEILVNGYNKTQSDLHSSTSLDNYAKQEIITQIQTITKMLQSIESQINAGFNEENIDKAFSKILPKYFKSIHNETNLTRTEEGVDEDTKQIMLEIFGPNPNMTTPKSKTNSSKDIEVDEDMKKVLLEVFGPNPNLTNAVVDEDTHKSLVDVFGTNLNATNVTVTAPDTNVVVDEDTRQVLVDIFGTNPNITKADIKATEGRTNCNKNFTDLITIRGDTGSNCDESKPKRRRTRRKKNKPLLLDVRGNFDSGEDLEYEEVDEDVETATTDNLRIGDEEVTTESTTDINGDVLQSLAAQSSDT